MSTREEYMLQPRINNLELLQMKASGLSRMDGGRYGSDE